MGERWGTCCFPAFSSCSLPQKTRENSRRMTENVCEFFVLPLENTKKRDVKSLENCGEQRNTIRSSCVNRMFSVCFTWIIRALTGPVNTSKTSVFLVLTEPENYRIMERILKFTGQKTTGKEWILRPENAREF